MEIIITAALIGLGFFVFTIELASLVVYGLPFKKQPSNFNKEFESSRLNSLNYFILCTDDGYISNVPISIYGKYCYKNMETGKYWRISYFSKTHRLIKSRFQELIALEK